MSTLSKKEGKAKAADETTPKNNTKIGIKTHPTTERNVSMSSTAAVQGNEDQDKDLPRWSRTTSFERTPQAADQATARFKAVIKSKSGTERNLNVSITEAVQGEDDQDRDLPQWSRLAFERTPQAVDQATARIKAVIKSRSVVNRNISVSSTEAVQGNDDRDKDLPRWSRPAFDRKTKAADEATARINTETNSKPDTDRTVSISSTAAVQGDDDQDNDLPQWSRMTNKEAAKNGAWRREGQGPDESTVVSPKKKSFI